MLFTLASGFSNEAKSDFRRSPREKVLPLILKKFITFGVSLLAPVALVVLADHVDLVAIVFTFLVLNYAIR